MAVVTPPTPRRMGRPRWLNVRVVGGVLLLVLSIAVGTKVIGAASRTSPVWAVAQDVSAGTVLTAADLVAVDANLGDHARLYSGTGRTVVGAMLNRPLTAGELIPQAALGDRGDARVLSVAVTGDHVAPGVTHGSVVDLYLVTGGTGLAGHPVETRLLRSGVTVQSVAAPASGGLSGAVSSRYQVALLLAAPEADSLVRELPLGEPVFVLHAGAASGVAGG